ncbi:hypothetical protein OG453_01240 [Streptomyces sp. NBC_01381]|uniref:hypothetical protein n=1 Tax=Streptomyces sp. NBC_01381 TaxID=2903845 RepID=UPI002252C31C|nr:hypothetical protein [Streptomyces sp. NBC_01381]MCX4665310.1 hypothetical protein [Streptomyces sp. NBC_01381]
MPTPEEASAEQKRLAQETKNEKLMWWYLAYFLFGIHIIAFVMIFAIKHAK